MLCKNCGNFVLNGGMTSHEIIYDCGKAKKLGNCKLTGALKNELNTCAIMENK